MVQAKEIKQGLHELKEKIAIIFRGQEDIEEKENRLIHLGFNFEYMLDSEKRYYNKDFNCHLSTNKDFNQFTLSIDFDIYYNTENSFTKKLKNG